MKQTLNQIGWTGLILMLMICLALGSCKKDEESIPTPTPITNTINTYSSTKYVRISVKQKDEADTIWMMGDSSNYNTLKPSCPIACAEPDTMEARIFYHKMRAYPLKIDGHIEVVGNILTLNYTELNTLSNTPQHSGVVNAKYIRQ